jgi:uncharacterized protein YcbK (DUF882 family)
MQLSKNFTLAELVKSETATKNKFTEQFTPPPQVVSNLIDLCTDILQPFRDKWGKAVKLSSGYRCLRLNTAVKGVKSSAHVSGKAVDISIVGLSQAEVFKMVELLIEVGAKRIGLGWSFIHVDNDYSKPTPAVFLYGSKTPTWLSAKKEVWLKMIKWK